MRRVSVLTAISFAVFLLSFVGVGIWSASRKTETAEDYLVASRNVNPWLAALSAVSTNNSGFMFMGLIGTAFESGISASWLMIGWIGGDVLAWFFVHKPLREKSAKEGATSIPGFLAGASGNRAVAAVAGLIVLVFLALYAGAQLHASGKALFAVSGLSANVGAAIGAVMVAIYCFSGDIRASIWTDVAQSFVMIAAMVLVYFIAVSQSGGHGAMWEQLAAIDNGDGAGLTDWTPEGFKFGIVGYILGWFGAGFGAVGQPHVMIRAMAVDSPESISKMRNIYTVWYIVFSIACIGVGLAARLLLTGPEYSLAGGYDPELSLLDLVAAVEISDVLIGLTLAGLFAATISTADSQILSCSAAVSQDIAPGSGRSYIFVKATTLGITAGALIFAILGEAIGDGVFGLVTLAWATLAAGLGPLMVVRAVGGRVTTSVAIPTMLAGIAANLVWRYGLGWHNDLYDVLPGMLTGFLVYIVMSYATLGGIRRESGSES